jgi:hypothetical protein
MSKSGDGARVTSKPIGERMQWLKTISSELFRLFVDDGSFAAAIIIWLGISWLLSAHFFQHAEWSGAVLFAGLGLILLESTTRRARK